MSRRFLKKFVLVADGSTTIKDISLNEEVQVFLGLFFYELLDQPFSEKVKYIVSTCSDMASLVKGCSIVVSPDGVMDSFEFNAIVENIAEFLGSKSNFLKSTGWEYQTHLKKGCHAWVSVVDDDRQLHQGIDFYCPASWQEDDDIIHAGFCQLSALTRIPANGLGSKRMLDGYHVKLITPFNTGGEHQWVVDVFNLNSSLVKTPNVNRENWNFTIVTVSGDLRITLETGSVILTREIMERTSLWKKERRGG